MLTLTRAKMKHRLARWYSGYFLGSSRHCAPVTCHHRFQRWVREGKLERILRRPQIASGRSWDLLGSFGNRCRDYAFLRGHRVVVPSSGERHGPTTHIRKRREQSCFIRIRFVKSALLSPLDQKARRAHLLASKRQRPNATTAQLLFSGPEILAR
jgi:hypothetical protein